MWGYCANAPASSILEFYEAEFGEFDDFAENPELHLFHVTIHHSTNLLRFLGNFMLNDTVVMNIEIRENETCENGTWYKIIVSYVAL